MSSVDLLWVVSPTTEVYTGFSLTESLSAHSIFDGRRRRRMCIKRQHKWNSCSLNAENQGTRGGFPVLSSLVANPTEDLTIMSSEQRVYDVVSKQAALVDRELRSRDALDLDIKPDIAVPGTLSLLGEAYDRCGKVCAEYAKTFY
ncbi:hypothetical protein KSS87_020873, partial [Heliosperma pusillum]